MDMHKEAKAKKLENMAVEAVIFVVVVLLAALAPVLFGQTTVSIQCKSRPDASECAATAAMSRQRCPGYCDSATLLTSSIAPGSFGA